MENHCEDSCCSDGKACGYFGLKPKNLLVLVLIVGAVGLGVLAILRDRIVNVPRYTVSFTGEGKVYAKPDIAQIQLAVKTDRAKDAATAVKTNTDKMNQVIKKLKDLGIDEKDIKTTSYNLNPEYDYPINVGRGILAGYSVYQEVTVKVRNLDNIGKVIEQTTAAGANQIGNIAFTIDDMSEVNKEARAEAVAKAIEQAKNSASLTGMRLGKIVNVYESSNNQPMPMYYAKTDSAMGMGGGGVASAPSIQTGQNEVVLNVTITYEVK